MFRTPEELLETVVLIDKTINTTTFGGEILRQMQEDFAKSGRVKCSVESLDIKNSIRWIAKSNKDCSIYNTCQMEKIVLVLVSANDFIEMFKNQPNLNAERFLINVLKQIPDPDLDTIQIHLIKDKKSTACSEDKILEAEMKQIINKKALDMSAECLVMYKTDLHLELLDTSKISALVSRTTKSILELIQNRASALQNEEGLGYIVQPGSSTFYKTFSVMVHEMALCALCVKMPSKTSKIT